MFRIMKNLFRLRRPLGLLAIALPVAVAACSLKSDAIAPTIIVPIESTTFEPTLGVDLAHSTKTANGVYIRDITVGTGTVAAPGVTMTVRYVGRLSNGAVFDSTTTNPFTFTLGVTNLIAGWTEGVAGMKVGGSRQLIIPPSMGYGSAYVGAVPPNSILVFRVDLIGAQ